MIAHNQSVIEIFLMAYKRFEKRMKELAFDHCDYEKKCSEKCYEKRECSQEGIVRYWWRAISRWN